MFCRKCGNEMLDNQRFCDKCGTKNENVVGYSKIEKVAFFLALGVVILSCIPLGKVAVYIYSIMSFGSLLLSAIICYKKSKAGLAALMLSIWGLSVNIVWLMFVYSI